MAVKTKTKIDVIETDLSLMFPQTFSPQARSKEIARFAREKLKEGQDTNRRVLGRVPTHETVVDGRHTTVLESVRPDGTIVFEFDLYEDVFAWIGEQLVKHSPIGDASDKRPGHPGAYMASHVFVVDGEVVDPGKPMPPRWDKAVFLSTVPYARKIERGLSDQAPYGVYEVVAALAQKRFGNIASIGFGFEAPMFGAIDAWASKTGMASPYRRGAKREEWLRRQPAVVIYPR